MNELRTGDVVMFSRKWYTNHIPAALLIKAYTYINKTKFDHCGVVVEDNIGNYYLFENTMFGGYQLRKLEARIMHSLSQRIEAIPLRPAVELTNEQRAKLYSRVTTIVANKDLESSEFPSILRGLVVGACRQVFPAKWVQESYLTGKYICPSVRFITATLLLIENTVAPAPDGDGEARSDFFDATRDGSFENLSCADVDSGALFNLTSMCFDSGIKDGPMRRKGQGYNHHINFR